MRVIVIFIVSIYFCNICRAQDYYIEDPHVSFEGGLIFGANFTQVDGDTYSGYHKIGINGGGTVYIHFTKTFGVSMELLYSQKGSRAVSDAQSASIGLYAEQYHMNLNYVEVPVLLHLRDKNFDIEGGASYARLVNSSEWVFSDQPVIIDPVLNRFNNSDFEYIIGLGRKIYKKWYIDGRFQYSITNIRPSDRVPLGFTYGDKGQFNNICVLRLIRYL